MAGHEIAQLYGTPDKDRNGRPDPDWWEENTIAPPDGLGGPSHYIIDAFVSRGWVCLGIATASTADAGAPGAGRARGRASSCVAERAAAAGPVTAVAPDGRDARERQTEALVVRSNNRRRAS